MTTHTCTGTCRSSFRSLCSTGTCTISRAQAKVDSTAITMTHHYHQQHDDDTHACPNRSPTLLVQRQRKASRSCTVTAVATSENAALFRGAPSATDSKVIIQVIVQMQRVDVKTPRYPPTVLLRSKTNNRPSNISPWQHRACNLRGCYVGST